MRILIFLALLLHRIHINEAKTFHHPLQIQSEKQKSKNNYFLPLLHIESVTVLIFFLYSFYVSF